MVTDHSTQINSEMLKSRFTEPFTSLPGSMQPYEVVGEKEPYGHTLDTSYLILC